MIELIFPKRHTALSLNSAFFGFFAHTGFVRGLQEIGFKPSIITGCSSGALVGALYASGADMREVERMILGLKKGDFWEGNFFHQVQKLFRHGLKDYSGVLTGKATRALLNPFLGVKTFKDLPIKLGLAVSNLTLGKRELIQEGIVIDAVMASIAFPILYEIQKKNGQEYLDGGIADPEPIKELILDPAIDRIIIHAIDNSKPSHSNLLKRAFDASVRIIESETSELKELLAASRGKTLLRITTKTPYLSPSNFKEGAFAMAEAKGSAYLHASAILGKTLPFSLF